MVTSKQIIFKIIVDIIIVVLMSLPLVLVYLEAVPHQQGFFCDDNSIKYPFKKNSSVPDGILMGYTFGVPMIAMLIVEVIDAKFNKNHITKKLTIGTWDVPSWLHNSYRHIGYFLFGNACTQTTTMVLKYAMGRLRPHFFAVCKPLIDCSAQKNIGRYITDYTCQETDATSLLREMRLSFPSGHASFAGFAMVYCALYLQVRMTWNGSAVFKHSIQFVLILLALYTGISRVVDFKHHSTDVLAGLFLGISYAFLVAKFVSKLFDKNSEVILDLNLH